MIKIKVKKLKNSTNLPLPKYETAGSVGMDLLSSNKKSVLIKKGEFKLIPTGISISLPKNYEAQIRPRSGLSIKNGVTVLNSPGTIDSDYRGELCVILINHGKKDFVVKYGARIAQMVIAKTEKAVLKVEKKLSKTSRGTGGFGSTGR
ncbi:MAG: Deoxyuridine 5'-triphosphate nucleotidohydrolase [Alphaproteobacteria bacterium MarineAlpha5_Bin11]|nr:MAG: Deoxyuridine 5'-triphosphate nucleotidohydrolase [Alphaproteobacteria bacterium MarineAlpha5_Bin11]PPR52133.1 MAG: Deoxyuridine 5'-triphosphate nucleotidohydrolase [Alphaproteobacteria bacterium MarineAlpha5_Bin10]|tara:strand:+ start:59 stop:502 length:444 start_codon:yes stop_codon:yes gene_type:complete